MEHPITFFPVEVPLKDRPALVPEGSLGVYLIDVRLPPSEFGLEGHLKGEVDDSVIAQLNETEPEYRGRGAESPVAEFRNKEGQVVTRLIWDVEANTYLIEE